MALVSRLIGERQAAKLTQMEVAAERMGAQQAAVVWIESERIKPTLEKIERCAAATGYKVDIWLVSLKRGDRKLTRSATGDYPRRFHCNIS